MNQRNNILKRLRRVPASSQGVLPEPVPANKAQGNSVDYFITQAKKSGADVYILDESVVCNERGLEDNRVLHVDAALAIAETGSVVLLSHAVSTAKAFLCERLIVSIKRSDVIPYLHEALNLLHHSPARAIHIVTGPSRTADVEQTIQIGAHGPKAVSYVILDDK